MKKIIIYAVWLMVVSSISAQVVSKSDSIKIEKAKIDSVKNAQRASDLVVNAAIDDMQEKYAEAILNYQEALQLDPEPGIHFAISKSYLHLQKVQKALEHAKMAVAGAPNDAEYLKLLGRLYIISQKVDSARSVYERIVKIDSTSSESLFTLAQIYETNNPGKALNVYKRILNLVGPDWDVLVKIAGLNERLGKVDDTILILKKLAKQNPSNLDLQKLLIQTYLKNKNYDDAVVQATDAIKLFPNNVNLVEMKAQAFIRKKEWDNGANEYIKLIHAKSIPFETKIKIASGFVNEAMNDSTLLNIAVQVLNAIDQDSTAWQVHSMLGEVYGKEKNDSLSIVQYRKASKLAEWNSQVLSKLGVALFQAGKYQECIAEMSKAIKKFPDDYVINFVYGLSLSQLKRNKEAEPFLAKAVVLNPNDVNTLSVYGFTLNQLKKDNEALTYITKALSLDPKNTQLLGMAGMICDGKKQYKKCDYYYEKAISIDSTNALILNNYAYSISERNIYSDAKKKMQLNKALKMVNISLEQDPENSSYLDTKGWIYYQLGNLDSAKIYVQRSLKKEGDNASVLEHLGDIEFKLNNKNGAIKHWKQALEHDKNNKELKLKIKKGKI